MAELALKDVQAVVSGPQVRPVLGSLLARDFAKCGQGAVRVVLPVGVTGRDESTVREAVVNPLSGADEMWIDQVGGEISIAEWVSKLIDHCVVPLSRAEIDDFAQTLTVADRDLLVLYLRMLTFGPELWGVTACPFEGCQARLDVTFDLQTLEIPSKRTPGGRYSATVEYRELSPSASERLSFRYREPNGFDQEAVARQMHSDPGRAFLELLSRCVTEIDVRNDITADTLRRLPQRALEAMDRTIAEGITSFDWDVRLTCPECGRDFTSYIDIQAYFHEELRMLQDDLWQEVHEMAFYYHWEEPVILSLPRWKRKRFLKYIRDEVNRPGRVGLPRGYHYG